MRASLFRLNSLVALGCAFGTVTLLAACGGGSDDVAPPAPAPVVGSVKSVTLVVGGGTCGATDGSASIAQLGNVRDMKASRDGTVYTLERSCDGTPDRVRSISPDGTVTTMAQAFSGSVEPGTLLPSFRSGQQLAIGDSGAVYLSEALDGHFLRPMYSPGSASGIWKITSTGAQPFVGLQEQSFEPVDGQGLGAKFDEVSNMVFALGALLVQDFGGDIRRVTEDGTVTTITLPMRPDMVDNAGALYQVERHFAPVTKPDTLTRFDGRVTPIDGIAWPLAIAGDGAVYGIPTDSGLGIRRNHVDGTTQMIEGPPEGPQAPWATESRQRVANMTLDHAGNLYVVHKHQLWRVTFVQ